MENASKALIIAGAILLSILLISLGLIVYNQAKETIGSVNLSQQEIEAFNSKFSSYEGENVSGAKVNQLIQTVIASNQQAIDDSTNAYVTLTASDTKDANNTVSISVSSGVASISTRSKVTPGKTYTVTYAYNNARVSGITITATY